MIDTGAIRKKVLEMAMKGELTQRCNNDSCSIPQGHALTEVSDIPYKIPDAWIWATVGDVIAKNVGGGTPSKSVTEYWKNGTIPWATVKDFSSAKNGMISDTVDHITQVGLDNSSANLIDTDAIVICMRMALGKIVRFSKPMAINQDLRAVWLQPFILQSFFVYFYSTLKVEGRGTTVAGIRKEELMSFPIPVPPLAEQQRIVERVESIFSLLDEIDAAQKEYADNLDSLKSKLIDLAIQGKITTQLETERCLEYFDLMGPFSIPQNWTWAELKSVTFNHGQKKPASDFCYIDVGTLDNVNHRLSEKENVIKKEDAPSRARKIVKFGDVLYSTVRPYLHNICIINKLFSREPIASTAFAVLCPDKDILISEYLMIVLLSSYFDTYANGGNSKGVLYPAISEKDLLKGLIPVPPIAEQNRIVDKLNELLPLCS